MSNKSSLTGKTIAILATDGFEQAELVEPKKNLENEGAKVEILSLKEGKIKGWDETDWEPPSKSTARLPTPNLPSSTHWSSRAVR